MRLLKQAPGTAALMPMRRTYSITSGSCCVSLYGMRFYIHSIRQYSLSFEIINNEEGRSKETSVGV